MAKTPSYIPVPHRPQPGNCRLPFPSPEPSSSAPISRSAPEKWPSLRKYRSWSPDSAREEAWLRKQELHRERQRRRELCRSVTEEDLDELKGCSDLGFAIDELDSPGTGGSGRWSETFPALEVYLMHQRYSNAAAEDDLMGTSSSARSSSVSGSSSMYICSASGDSPEEVKEKLKLWAQVVASSARQRS